MLSKTESRTTVAENIENCSRHLPVARWGRRSDAVTCCWLPASSGTACEPQVLRPVSIGRPAVANPCKRLDGSLLPMFQPSGSGFS